jgi:hypothetical protein
MHGSYPEGGNKMRKPALSILVVGCLLSGCNQQGATSGPGPKSQGRYAGIGTYDAGRLWSQMAGIADPSDAAAARLDDDQHIIVVVDSHTGEVRQCGDFSGVCVAMNPWSGAGSRSAAPVKLKKHAADLAAEDEANAAAAEAASNAATPAR